ncbi:MAG: efflux RND transporter permease subunit [Myxococcota bacterium]|jgi:HAE1 family hydrophobic/amphiphilic exporter-1|nr:efflux RND transporter permease subunit [Myxococcota bacterium]
MKLADVSIKRPVFATVMILVLVVFGALAYTRMGVDLMPKVDFPVVTITAVYPGADPETIESKVVDKIEESVNTVSGLKTLTSTSMENVGFVVAQFELDVDSDRAIQDIRDKVSGILGELPSDLEPPLIQKFDLASFPIMTVALYGDKPIRELTRYADDVLKQRLQTIEGVGGIDVVGGQERQFNVLIKPALLEKHGITVGDVQQALAVQNVDVPGGNLDSGRQELSIKTKGQVHGREELENIIIASIGGSPLRIGQVAEVVDGEEEQRSYSSYNGQPAVSLVIRKSADGNTVSVSEGIRETLDDIELPEGLSVALPLDNSEFIVRAIDDALFDLVFGAILAVLIILLFLHDWKATIISALALPTSVIAAFAFMQALGFTFNIITMLALSLSIGILIDDAIVVIENIYRHLQMGKGAMQAAREASAEIGLAVLATTLSIIAVFVPVAFMRGIIGRFFLQFGLTVAFAVAVSLFVAFTLTPMLSSRWLKPHKPGLVGRILDAPIKLLEWVYRRILLVSMRLRFVTLLLAFAVLAGSMYLGKDLKAEFMPKDDQSAFKVSFELPIGSNLDASIQYATEVEALLREQAGVTSVMTTIGGGVQGEVHRGEFVVNMVRPKQRMFSQFELMDRVRQVLKARQDGVKVVLGDAQSIAGGGMGETQIQYLVQGQNYEELAATADKLVAAMREKGGYVDLDTSYRAGKPELAIRIDRNRAADLGVPMVMIAMTIRTLFAGEKATELLVDGERHEVRVRLPEELRRSADSIYNLSVRSTSGQLVSMSNLVTVDPGSGPATIERYARQRQITVRANLDGSKALGAATEEIDAMAKELLPPGVSGTWAGESEILEESIAGMVEALVLAIILIFLILAAQYESWVQPLIIMLSLPLSLIGAVGALVLTDSPVSIFTMIGFIMLMGLVTKNAILLVDYANQCKAEGMSTLDAVVKAGVVRMRPILMTTVAMIFGMLPIAMAISEGSEGKSPMAVTVIGGLATSMVLTLVVVPVVYSLVDSAAVLLGRLSGRRAEPELLTQEAE